MRATTISTCGGRALRRNQLQRATRHRRDVGPVGLTGLLRTDFFPVCVSLFLLSGVVNEKIKGQFEDENAKFRPVPPVPDTGC